MKYILSGALCFIFISSSQAGVLGPSNEDECVLENMKNAKIEIASQLVMNACYSKTYGNKLKSMFSKETYEDCILKGIKNVSNDYSARMLVSACMNKS